MARLYKLDPLTDPRWLRFLQSHPDASIFHTPEWLEALRRTYRYTPVVFTTCAPGAALTNGIAFARVESWITGRRLVSVPFADHCQPLANSQDELRELVGATCAALPHEACDFVELRPLPGSSRLFLPRNRDAEMRGTFRSSARFHLHTLDLSLPLEQLFQHTHKSSFQRKVRRAEREQLTIARGLSPELLRKFYVLLVRTRRRHGVPPQPLAWFHNLAALFRDAMTISVAEKGGQPVAGIVTLRHKSTVVYKYGGSDERYHALGGVAGLFWSAISAARAGGAHEMDLGRSDLDNPGLNVFKERLGARAAILEYYRCPPAAAAAQAGAGHSRLARRMCTYLPDRWLIAAGNVLYRHLG
ncbi:MAG TPA: GNAT family N-acetyltransferase [Terriglobales bacterium]|nr:GNAT family N-acetyltransferase [Terriglobales bacterium]